MKGKIGKTLLTLAIIITMTLANFLFLGVNVVSYAAEELSQDVSTNNKNVEFGVTLIDQDGKEANELEAKMDSENLKLHLEISVKRDGYFNGIVTLGSSNFRLKQDVISEGISKIEGNTITLDQVNAGETKELEVGIEIIKDDTFDINSIDMESNITLNGIYKDSSEKDITITATKTAKLILTSPYNKDYVGSILKYELITNKVVDYSGEPKRVIQLKVTSGIENNLYPIKNQTLEIPSPKVEDKYPVEVTLNSIGTLATNGEKLERETWEYDEETGKITVNIENAETDGKVNWVKEGQDNIIVTYIYDTTEESEEQKIEGTTKIELYDKNKTTISAGYEMTMGPEEKDEIISLDTSSEETSIYKGKLYAGIDREITQNVSLNVNMANVASEISLVENIENIGLQNVYTSKVTFSKQNLQEILGEDFNLSIINNETNQTIETINKDTKTDENGNIAINLGENVKQIKITTSAPVNVGTIGLKIAKLIKENTRQLVNEANTINFTIEGTYTSSDMVSILESKTAVIALEETETSAQITIDRTELSTMTVNEDVEIRVVLNTNSEKDELYTNPTIRIEFPEQIQTIDVISISPLYADEFEIVKTYREGNDIVLELQGEQQEYSNEAIEGPTFIIKANLTVDKKVPSSTQNILLTYTNENAVNYKNGAMQGEEQTPINIIAYTGMVTNTTLPDYGMQIINNDGEKTAKLELSADQKQITFNSEIINNTGDTASNVKILGTYPNKNEENNIDIAVSALNIQGIDTSKVAIYYTENSNATDDITNAENSWTQEITNPANVQKYLIIIDSLDISESINFSYNMAIPSNLEYNQVANLGYGINYTEATGVNKNITLDTIKLETGVGPILETSIKAYVGPEEVTAVTKGELVKYELTITNTGSEDVTNVQMQGQVPEGTVYAEEVMPQQVEESNNGAFIEDESIKQVDYTIENLPVGESITKTYYVRVKENVGTISNTSTITYGEVTKQSEDVRLAVNDGILDFSMVLSGKSNYGTADSGNTYEYVAKIKNNSTQNINNIQFEPSAQNAEVTGIRYYSKIQEKQVSIEETENVIDMIEAGEEKEIVVSVSMPNTTQNQNVNISATCTYNNQTYRSNQITVLVNGVDLTISNTSENQNDYVKAGDIITYNITIKNNGETSQNVITLKDEISNLVTIQSIKKNGEDLPEDQYVIYYNKNIEIETSLAPGEEQQYEIQVIVNYIQKNEEAKEITNIATLDVGNIEVGKQEVMHILEPEDDEQISIGDPDEPVDPEDPDEPVDPEDPDTPTDPEDPDTPTDPEDPDTPTDPEDPDTPTDPEDPDTPTDPEDPQNPNTPSQQTRIISGRAWLDLDSDGSLDQEETLLDGITVRLLDTNTNTFAQDMDGREITTTTNSSGFYSLNRIPQGEYIVVFEYDTSKYILTDYNKEGVQEALTSKVINKTITIDGESRNVAATDIITIENDNIANINIGLKEAKIFDLKLDKYVSKIIVQNSSGTETQEYTDETLAKTEIHSKQLNGSTVLVEYTIRVTNEGEVAGYARSIVDYLSSEYRFSSELNSDWYQSGQRLYNTSLSSELIEPGESKDIKLTVTKQMTVNNTGLINNKAEIAESYNELGLEDVDSTPGNNLSEDDLGSADVLISIKTGQVVGTVVIIIAIVAILTAVAIIIARKILKRKII